MVQWTHVLTTRFCSLKNNFEAWKNTFEKEHFPNRNFGGSSFLFLRSYIAHCLIVSLQMHGLPGKCQTLRRRESWSRYQFDERFIVEMFCGRIHVFRSFVFKSNSNYTPKQNQLRDILHPWWFGKGGFFMIFLDMAIFGIYVKFVVGK